MIQGTAGRLPRTARHDVDGADRTGLPVGASVILAATVAIENHFGCEGGGDVAVAVDEEGPFVAMAVAAQHEVHAVGLEEWQDVLAHLPKLNIKHRIVRIMG